MRRLLEALTPTVPLPTATERAAAVRRLADRAAKATTAARTRSFGGRRAGPARGQLRINDGYVRTLLYASAGRCWLTGIPMAASGPLQMSLDRIDSTKPYEYGNLQPVCLVANLAKRDRSDEGFRGFLLGLLQAPAPAYS